MGNPSISISRLRAVGSAAAGERLRAAVVGPALAVVLVLGGFLRFFRLSSVPPGLTTDESYYAMDALRVVTDHVHPIFFEANNGREPLFIYLEALAMRLMGPSPLTVRLVSAALGLLTVAIMYPLVSEALATERPRVRQAAGLFAALALATLYWHVHYSHLALRAISFPLFEALALWLFWRARRIDRTPAYVLAGLALGLSLYTYLAARLLPLLIAYIVALLVFGDYHERERLGARRVNWRGLAAFVAAALLVFLPLGVYFWQHPDTFLFRLGQISPANPEATAGQRQDIWSNTARTLLMFTGAGDWGWADNIPGRPVLDVAAAAGFFAGLAAVAWRWRQVRYTQWVAWLALMLLPSAITIYAPTQTRSIGAVVPLAGLLGIGFAQIWSWGSRAARTGPAGAVPLLGVLLVGFGAFSGWTTYRDYYGYWASRPEVAKSFDVDMRMAGRAVTELPRGSDVYVSFVEEGGYQPSLDFAVREASFAAGLPAEQAYNLRWHNSDCLVLPPATGRSAAYLLAPDQRSLLPMLKAILPGGQTGSGYGLGGSLLFNSYVVAPAARAAAGPLKPANPAQAHFGDSVLLLGADVPPGSVRAGDGLDLLLYWRVDAALARPYTIFAQLVGDRINAGGNPVWGQNDAEPCAGSYPTTAWEPGSTVIVRHHVPVGSNAPAGAYRLLVGMYDRPTGERMPVTDEGGRAVAENAVQLATIVVQK